MYTYPTIINLAAYRVADPDTLVFSLRDFKAIGSNNHPNNSHTGLKPNDGLSLRPWIHRLQFLRLLLRFLRVVCPRCQVILLVERTQSAGLAHAWRMLGVWPFVAAKSSEICVMDKKERKTVRGKARTQHHLPLYLIFCNCPALPSI